MANFFRQIFAEIDDFVRKIFDQVVSPRTLVITKNLLENALDRGSSICIGSVQDQPDWKRLTVAQSRTPSRGDYNRRLNTCAKQINLPVWVAAPCLPLEGAFRFDSIQKLLAFLALIGIPIHRGDIAERCVFEGVTEEKREKGR